MIRCTRLALSAALVLSCGLSAAPAAAREASGLAAPFLVAAADDATGAIHHHHRSTKRSHTPKPRHREKEESEAKPKQIGNYGDWGAFVAEAGDDKTCYVLAEPKTREPSSLKRDPAYVFISDRPGEHIRNEVSITMGFPMKDGGEGEAEVAGTTFALISKGKNAWIKNPAEEGRFISALRRNAKLVVKAPSTRGRVTTDTYSLAGVRQALDEVGKACR